MPRRFVYSRWDGTQRGFELDADALMEQLTDEVEHLAWEYIQNNVADLYNSTLAQIPRGSMGTPAEVANAVVFLASPAASLITGVNLIADGGFTKRVQL